MPESKHAHNRPTHGEPAAKKPTARGQHTGEADLDDLLRRMAHEGKGEASVAQVQALQRQVGNQAVTRMVREGQLQPQASGPVVRRKPIAMHISKTPAGAPLQRVTVPSVQPGPAWWKQYLFDLKGSEWRMYSDPALMGDAATFDKKPIHITVSGDSIRQPGSLAGKSAGDADALIHNMLSQSSLMTQIHATLDVIKGDPSSNPHYFWMGPGGQGGSYPLRNKSWGTLYEALSNFATNFMKPKVVEAIKDAPKGEPPKK